jgi:hypothetical protein
VIGSARALRWAQALAVIGLCVTAGVSSAAGDDGLPPPEPGRLEGSVATTGRAELAVGKQWFRLPRMALWARVGAADPSTGPGQAEADPPNVAAEVYLLSPAGSRHAYGEGPAFGVRTLAFGMIPAEATVQIAQLRQGRYPRPWTLTGGPVLSEGDHVMEGVVEVRILGLELDGKQVPDLTGVCRSGTASLRLEAGPGYLPYGGGELAGTIDVPAFSGCGSRELDRLVTSIVAGDGNRIEVRQGAISIGQDWPQQTPPEFPLDQ